jgi:hypothetical protein
LRPVYAVRSLNYRAKTRKFTYIRQHQQNLQHNLQLKCYNSKNVSTLFGLYRRRRLKSINILIALYIIIIYIMCITYNILYIIIYIHVVHFVGVVF